MRKFLQEGEYLETKWGRNIKIKQWINRNWKSSIYLIEDGNSIKILKWFHKVYLEQYNGTGLYWNIVERIKSGMPNENYLELLNITNWIDGEFGYIMELIPKGYYGLTDYIFGRISFSSYKVMLDACLSLVVSLNKLFIQGLCHGDLNENNIWFHPTTGKLLIKGNENIVCENILTTVGGTLAFRAPETISADGKSITMWGNRYSMAVIIFMLLCGTHPLLGNREKWLYEEGGAERVYQSEALFIFDPDNTTNHPDGTIKGEQVRLWEALPNDMKEIFIQTFGQKALHHPSRRPSMIAWIKALVHFRSNIVDCGVCGKEVLVEKGKIQCPSCQNFFNISYWFKVMDYGLPAAKGLCLYRCQTEICSAREALDIMGVVIEHEEIPGMLGIRNKSAREWYAITSQGQERKVKPGMVIPLKANIQFRTDSIWEKEVCIIEENIMKTEKTEKTIENYQNLLHIPQGICSIPSKKYIVFFVLDTSGSMIGKRLHEMMLIMENALNTLGQIQYRRIDRSIRIEVMTFNYVCEWLTPDGAMDVDDFYMEKPGIGGGTDLAKTLHELDTRLREREIQENYMEEPGIGGGTDLAKTLHELDARLREREIQENGEWVPMIIFISDANGTSSFSMYDYDEEIERIHHNPTFQKSIKMVWGIGKDWNREMFKEIINSREGIYREGIYRGDRMNIKNTLYEYFDIFDIYPY